jgi:hypothetical protein
MKQMIELFAEIDGYAIIRGFDVCPIDPEETRAAVELRIRENPELAETAPEGLFSANAVYSASLGPGRKLVSEAEYADHKAKFDALGERQCLTAELEVVQDLRNVEYWEKTGDRWGKQSIEHIGEAAPSGAVLPDALSAAQREEIAAQERSDRIAALSPEDRANEKQAQIRAAIREAAVRKQEADIEAAVDDTAPAFDPVAWVRERKEEIEALYA